ncbi:hypothetical protein JZ751_005265 [Albula glossodonta]|uniref:Uncharacterized protein n=1 Tax=Albula glossodonta TaxID=121402 RepID=A0A8T2P8X8_9TELE|nr:hypothetical protein JZ751_005265 [Albula glossodonta]
MCPRSNPPHPSIATITAGSRLPLGMSSSRGATEEHALIATYVARLQGRTCALDSPSRLDEEHRLIARYAARLAAEAGNATVSNTPLLVSEDTSLHYRVALRISFCRMPHEQASQPTPEKAQQNPTLLAELRLLREILQEIQRLRLEHEQASQPTPEKAQQNPTRAHVCVSVT